MKSDKINNLDVHNLTRNILGNRLKYCSPEKIMIFKTLNLKKKIIYL